MHVARFKVVVQDKLVPGAMHLPRVGASLAWRVGVQSSTPDLRTRLKALAVRALTNDVTAPLWRRVMPSRAMILTFHRFREGGEADIERHSAAALRAKLAYLRRQNTRILSLAELLDRVAQGTVSSEPTVTFTVDDGYSDFHTIAAPIFAEFDCPVTVFLPTGFIDGQLWLWWDVLEYAFSATTHTSARVFLSSGECHYTWQSRRDRLYSARHLGELLERVDDEERRSVIQQLPAELEVCIPEVPTARFAPMSWADVRASARNGVTFGPHTYSHPIIAQLSENRVREEIAISWRRLREETDAAIPVFAIPNGQPYAFGSRDLRIAREAGMRVCVSTIPSYLSRVSGGHDVYCLPRFPCGDELSQFVQLVTGLEHAKAAIRSGFARLRVAASTSSGSL